MTGPAPDGRFTVSTPHAAAHHEPEYTSAVEALSRRFEGLVTRDDVVAAVEQAREEIEPGATVHDFLELLVERRARDLLTARSRSATGRLKLV